MKIACITKDIFAGGGGKSLYVLLSRLSNSLEINVFSFSRENSGPLKEKNIGHSTIGSGFYPFHFSSGARNPHFINYAAWFVRCLGLYPTINKIKKYAPDVVILNGFQSLWYARFLKDDVKVVLFARELLNSNYLDSRWALGLIDKYVDCVIAITENEASQLQGVKPPVHVVYNSYEGELSEENNNDAASKDYRIKDKIKIGVFGTIHRIKGQYLIIDLVDRYHDLINQYNIKFYLYGGASTVTTRDGGREQLEKLVSQKGYREFIEFPGWVNNVSTEMRKMDIILRTDCSGSPWGRDIIEAMSVSKPVIAAGQSEVFIKNGETGILFQPKNIDSMWQAINAVCSSREKMTQLGQNAFRFAKKNFDASINAAKVYDIIKNL